MTRLDHLLCRLLNIDDLQNAELWQKAGLLTAVPNDETPQDNSKQLHGSIASMQQNSAPLQSA